MDVFRLLLLIGLLALPQISFAAKPIYVAQEVLNRLYNIHGHFNTAKPGIELIDKKINVAVYIKSKNVIQIEKLAYKLCTSFGKDSTDVLAFILAHELIHALKASSNLPKTSFIAFDKGTMGSIEREREADIQGIFICYLAGFKTINLLPEIIDRMYELYGLNNKVIKGYPSLTERKQSSQLAINQANNLIELFNLSNRLSQISAFPQSIQCLEYISRYYQGKEVYTNLGINYALYGMNLSELRGESLVFPLELDWNIRIKKPKTGRGPETISPLVLLEQKKLFHKANEYFSITTKIDPQNLQADINLFAIEILLDNLENAQNFYTNYLRNSKRLGSNIVLSQKIQLLYAILSTKRNIPEVAISIWTNLSKDKNSLISTQAQHNLNVITNSRVLGFNQSSASCYPPNFTLDNIPDVKVKIRSNITEQWIILDSISTIERKMFTHSILYSFISKENPVFNIQEIRIPNKLAFKLNQPSTNPLDSKHRISICNKEEIAFVVDDTDNLNSLLRFHLFIDSNP